MQVTMFPLVAWDRIADSVADSALIAWQHEIGACNRPFGRQSFGLYYQGSLVAVAVSSSTVNATCGGYRRNEVVELSRLCTAPGQASLTRVAIRLWRLTAPHEWMSASCGWSVRAVVSYRDKGRHPGLDNIYRFDGWRKVKDVPGGIAGGGWQRNKEYRPKEVWAFDLDTRLLDGPTHEEVPG